MVDGKQVLALGYPQGRVVGLALKAANEYFADDNKALISLASVLRNPEAYIGHPGVGDIASELLRDEALPEYEWDVLEDYIDFPIFGSHLIDPNAEEQMKNAMRMPIAIRGALMPDAHQGYALPIGGVWETKGAVSPNAVGVDISCMLMLTVFSQSSIFLDQKTPYFEKVLADNTAFGRDSQSRKNVDIFADELMSLDNVEMLGRHEQTRMLKQLGSSGGGNHFAEFVKVEYAGEKNAYIGLLTHSGSRRAGFDIAHKYHNIAKSRCKNLPKAMQDYAYLAMSDEAGIEYWRLMNLMGEYALLNHRTIHEAILRDTELDVHETVWNRHNFAWLDDEAGTIIHRKGATPAAAGMRSLIPGTMTEGGYLVEGLGYDESINSASHGAGRHMSRKAAKSMLEGTSMEEFARESGIRLSGGGLDEHPDAYKGIEDVMKAQNELVTPVAKMTPRVVRMAND